MYESKKNLVKKYKCDP